MAGFLESSPLEVIGMRKWVGSIGIFSALVLALVFPSLTQAANYEIDTVHSQAIFKVKHMGVSYNMGRFNKVAGTYSFDPADPASASLDVKIEAGSIDTDFERRDEHLKSPDFFNAKQFPVISFTSNDVKKTGDAMYTASGELSLHGVKKNVTIEIEYVGQGENRDGKTLTGFFTTFTVKRSDYKMDFMVGPIGDEVTLMVNIEGVAQ